MKQQNIRSLSRPGAREKSATGIWKEVDGEIADIDLDRSVMRKMVLSTLMAFPAILVCIILSVLRLGAFWHYFLFATLLVFTILAFVEVYRLGKEIRGH
jgi:ABC-type antimicrobial peptide transport system permease subunit